MFIISFHFKNQKLSILTFLKLWLQSFKLNTNFYLAHSTDKMADFACEA
jgi:hypothetical protein